MPQCSHVESLSLAEINRLTSPAAMQRELDLLLEEEQEIEHVLAFVLARDGLVIDRYRHDMHACAYLTFFSHPLTMHRS